MNATRDQITREAGFAISYYAPSLRTSLSRSYHSYSDNDVVGSSVLPTHFEPMGFWGNSRDLTVPTSQTLFAFQASPTVRAKGSAMKPCSESHELLTVTMP